MKTCYSLWDIDTGTSLGAYATEDEARWIVRELNDANGPDYLDALELAREDETGGFERLDLRLSAAVR